MANVKVEGGDTTENFNRGEESKHDFGDRLDEGTWESIRVLVRAT